MGLGVDAPAFIEKAKRSSFLRQSRILLLNELVVVSMKILKELKNDNTILNLIS